MKGVNLKIRTDDPIELEKGEMVVKLSDLDDSAKFRAAIFATLGELDLEPRNDLILTSDELDKVQKEVMPRFPDLRMHDFWHPRAPLRLQTISHQIKERVLDEVNDNDNLARPTGAYTILHVDNPNGFPDHSWDLLKRMDNNAKQLARKVGVKFVKKGPYHFYYKGNGIDWRNGGKRLITEEALREWMARVDSGEFDEDDEAAVG